jgi:membrane protease YdiL (CAAX protease family)
MKEQPDTTIPWSPIAAVFFVVALYFIAPIIGALLLFPLANVVTDDVTSQFMYVLVAEALTVGGLVLFLRRYKKTLSFIGLKRPRVSDAVKGMLAYPLYFICFAIIAIVATQFIPALNVDQEQQLGFDNVKGAVPLILTFISLVILPPLVEEIVVRGFLFGSLRKYLKLGGAALLTSVIFAAAHLPEGGDAGPLYIAALDTFVLSMVLCWLREKTGSLWAGITLHAIKNGIAYLTLYTSVFTFR